VIAVFLSRRATSHLHARAMRTLIACAVTAPSHLKLSMLENVLAVLYYHWCFESMQAQAQAQAHLLGLGAN
jgi:hypothetical protein